MRRIKKLLKLLAEAWNILELLPPSYRKYKVVYYFDVLFCFFKYGAIPEDYISLELYKHPAEERKLFVTQRNKQIFMKYFYDTDSFITLTEKHLFSKRFSKFVTRDWLWSPDVSEQDVSDFIEKHGQVVVKPNSSTWGIGVQVIDKSKVDWLIGEMRGGEKFMIEEVIVNHPDIKRINPDSVNTLRVETCLDSKGAFHLLNVLLMIGTTKTIVSNCHSGGMMCHVNMETGEVDNAGFNPKGIWYEVHPVSGIKLRGFKIPFADKLEEYIKDVCQVMPNARYVGWDVVVTPTGFELIEGNYCPGQCTQTCDGIPKYEILKSYI